MSNDLKLNIIAQDSTGPGLSSVENTLNETLKTAERLIDKIVGLNAAMEKAASGQGLKTITNTAKEAEDAVEKVVGKAKEVKPVIDAVGGSSGLKKLTDDALRAGEASEKLGSKLHASLGANSSVLQNIGRVISDMPYGIMGVANNVEQLAASWGTATAAAGGSGAAIRGVLSALGGPAGLLMVGIPIVTSLAVAFGDDVVKAINASAESVDDLKKSLQGIQQYKDFDLTVKISGLEGIARLKAELAMLLKQKAYLEDKKAKADELSALGEESGWWSYLTPGGAARQIMRQPKVDEINARYQKKDERRAWDVFLGISDFGEENEALLKKIRVGGMALTPAQIQTTIANNRKNLEIAQNQSATGLAQDKENAKAARGGGSAAAKAAREAEALSDALYSASQALGDMGKKALPSVEDATKQVNDAAAVLRDAMKRKDTDDIRDATKALKDRQQVLQQTTTAWESAEARYIRMRAKDADATLSYTDSLKALHDAESETDRIRQLGSAHTWEYVEAINAEDAARIQATKSANAAAKKTRELYAAFNAIGDVFENQGISALLGGVYGVTDGQITKLANEQYGGDKSAAKIAAYAQLASGIGQMVGGKTGAVISNTASMASAGATLGSVIPGIGNVVGGVIGGVIGLASSLFGGDPSKGARDAQIKATHKENREKTWAQVRDNALSGGVYSQTLIDQYGYSVGSMLAKDGPLDVEDKVGDSIFMQHFLDRVNALDSAMASITAYGTTSTLQEIKAIGREFDYAIGMYGKYADLTTAYWDKLIVGITNISADSISTMISDAVSANVSGAAGKAFSDKFEESIAESIRNMAISNLVTNSIMPVLQPVMTSLVSGLVSGSLSSTEMAAMYGNVKAVAERVAPMVDALSQAFTTAGIGYNGPATNSLYNPNAFTSRYAYQVRQAGIPGFADGGTFAGGLRIVGELGPELEYTGPSRIVSHAETRRMLDSANVVAELKELRAQVEAGQYAIAKNTARTAQWIEKWEKDGLPKETTAP